MRHARCGALSTLLLGAGCVVWVRDPGAYREELIELVEVKDEPIKACYEAALQRHQLAFEAEEREAQGPYADIGPAVKTRTAELKGDVVVSFTVAAKTGKITAAVDEKATTAPADLARCVSDALQDLKLDPPDENKGTLVLTFSLKPGKHKKARPDAPAKRASRAAPTPDR